MIDTHAHLDACGEPADVIVARARESGVGRVLAVGSGIDSCRAALRLSAELSEVYAVLGIHPHQAESEEANRIAELRRLLSEPRAVAVGETGLDFYRDHTRHESQLALFRGQLELAGDLDLPVVVHSRDADEETAHALERFDGPVVLHCFSSPGLLPAALERGYYVSFAGNVTYPRAEALRTAATRIPAGRLLAETDSPYLAPQPRRGRPNEPANVRYTIETLAEARAEDPRALAAQIDLNASACFALP